MNVLITWAHPNPGSLNGALVKKIAEVLEHGGHAHRHNDLYRKGFDCCLDMKDFEAWGKGSVPDDVKKEQEDITWADALVFVYPIWWNERPAKLKGWCDRVLTKGFAWDFTEDMQLDGKLKDKKAMVVTTYGSPQGLYDHLSIDLEANKEPMAKGTLGYCGITNVTWVRELGVLMQDREANEAFVERVGEETKAFLG